MTNIDLDELERVTAELKHYSSFFPPCSYQRDYYDDVLAAIARLRAAESCIAELRRYIEPESHFAEIIARHGFTPEVQP